MRPPSYPPAEYGRPAPPPAPPRAVPLDAILCHLQVLKLEPGDVLVVTSSLSLSQAARLRICEEVAGVTGLGAHRIMVLCEGMNIGVLRAAAEEAPAGAGAG